RATSMRRASPAEPALRSSGPRRHSRRSLSANRLLQECLDERIDVAVHDPLDVRDLQFGAVVVDHRVWLEDVAANLAAEADVGLARLEQSLRSLTLLHFLLVQS